VTLAELAPAPTTRSGQVAVDGGGSLQKGDRERRPVIRRHRTWLYPALPASVLTFGLCVYMLHLPNVLYGTNQYDDGVYMGAALRLVNGVMPYRDFVLVHPPGILILMAPIALLGHLLGANVSLALGREVTAVVAALNVILVAAVVRHRGWRASALAATAMACFPMAAAADSTLFLEPYLVFFSLLGLALLTSKGTIVPGRRVLAAGVFLGFAGVVKIWAAFIVVAAVIVCARRARGALRTLVVGSAAGFALPCLPFFAAAPHSFLRDIIGDQFSRAVSGGASIGWSGRLSDFTGLNGITIFHPDGPLAVALSLAFVGLVAFTVVECRFSLVTADLMVLAAAVASVAALSLPHEMYSHYVYFSAPFLAASLAICLAEIVPRLHFIAGATAKHLLAGTVVGCVAMGAVLLPQQAGYARSHLASARSATFLNVFVPPKACILTDDIELLISADLFDPARPGCPAMTDAFGTWLADGPAKEPAYSGTARFGSTVQGPFPAKFKNEWATWLSQADYVVTLAQYSGYIPWTPTLASWFNANFHPLYELPHLWIYHRVGNSPPPVLS
jgi:alpha-1,2-mannosyltransferase